MHMRFDNENKAFKTRNKEPENDFIHESNIVDNGPFDWHKSETPPDSNLDISFEAVRRSGGAGTFLL